MTKDDAIKAIEGERAAVVKWLRDEADARFLSSEKTIDPFMKQYHHTRGMAVAIAADHIERGEHDMPQEKA